MGVAGMLIVRKGMMIHRSTSAGIMVCFPNHGEAHRPLGLSRTREVLNL